MLRQETFANHSLQDFLVFMPFFEFILPFRTFRELLFTVATGIDFLAIAAFCISSTFLARISSKIMLENSIRESL